MKLNVKAFALACGLIWGVGLFAFTWWLIMLEGATGEKLGIGRFYIGYNVCGMVWAFADAFIGGAIFAWLYNLLSRGAAAK